MIVKEFISKIADGSYTNNDIIEYAIQKEDKMDLLWCLYFADKVVIESTGKPQIIDEIQINRLDRAITLISQKFNISLFDKAIDDKFKLPNDLYNKRAQTLFDKAISTGLIIPNGDKLGWTKKKCLLAYFLKKVYLEDERGKTIQGQVCFPDKLLSNLFNVSRLGKDVSQLANNAGGKPKRGSEIIDNLFEEIT